MIKGEIFRGKEGSEAIHPIIFLSDIDDDFFLGAMLTSSVLFKDNAMMSIEHFQTHNLTNGEEYELQFNNSLLVKAKLIKEREWAPFRKVGELTAEGISFVETSIDRTREKLWKDYLSK